MGDPAGLRSVSLRRFRSCSSIADGLVGTTHRHRSRGRPPRVPGTYVSTRAVGEHRTRCWGRRHRPHRYERSPSHTPYRSAWDDRLDLHSVDATSVCPRVTPRPLSAGEPFFVPTVGVADTRRIDGAEGYAHGDWPAERPPRSSWKAHHSPSIPIHSHFGRFCRLRTVPFRTS